MVTDDHHNNITTLRLWLTFTTVGNFAVRGCQRHVAVDRRTDPRTSRRFHALLDPLDYTYYCKLVDPPVSC